MIKYVSVWFLVIFIRTAKCDCTCQCKDENGRQHEVKYAGKLGSFDDLHDKDFDMFFQNISADLETESSLRQEKIRKITKVVGAKNFKQYIEETIYPDKINKEVSNLTNKDTNGISNASLAGNIKTRTSVSDGLTSKNKALLLTVDVGNAELDSIGSKNILMNKENSALQKNESKMKINKGNTNDDSSDEEDNERNPIINETKANIETEISYSFIDSDGKLKKIDKVPILAYEKIPTKRDNAENKTRKHTKVKKSSKFKDLPLLNDNQPMKLNVNTFLENETKNRIDDSIAKNYSKFISINDTNPNDTISSNNIIVNIPQSISNNNETIADINEKKSIDDKNEVNITENNNNNNAISARPESENLEIIDRILKKESPINNRSETKINVFKSLGNYENDSISSAIDAYDDIGDEAKNSRHVDLEYQFKENSSKTARDNTLPFKNVFKVLSTAKEITANSGDSKNNTSFERGTFKKERQHTASQSSNHQTSESTSYKTVTQIGSGKNKNTEISTKKHTQRISGKVGVESTFEMGEQGGLLYLFRHGSLPRHVSECKIDIKPPEGHRIVYVKLAIKSTTAGVEAVLVEDKIVIKSENNLESAFYEVAAMSVQDSINQEGDSNDSDTSY